MIPTYLSDLRLDVVFSDYCTQVDLYILETSQNEHIVDSASAGISGFVSPTFGQVEECNGKYFEVKNLSLVPYSLIQIDNGVIKTKFPVKKCDCAIINRKELCFIEFKANANSRNPYVIEKKYKDAIEQIVSIKRLFDKKLEMLDSNLEALRNIEAHICFRRGYPRNTATMMAYQVSFAQHYGFPLSFKGEKIL